jgi:undecaprenyl diphosphate synthase
MQGLDREKLPRHLAIIMDGNGRWAQERMLKRIIGHQKGVETVRTIVEESSLLGIQYLTLFAFSSENWLRPKSEVRSLMSLLKRYIARETPLLMKKNICFNVSDKEASQAVKEAVENTVKKTSVNSGMVLTLALSYGARQEIIQAVKKLAVDMVAGKTDIEKLDERNFSGYLYTADLPEPDLLIRTSGEMRISNFLLWQIAYAELYFTEVNWPDFGKEEFYKALGNYQARERRYGLTSGQLQNRS